jgi:hypothetical protein
MCCSSLSLLLLLLLSLLLGASWGEPSQAVPLAPSLSAARPSPTQPSRSSTSAASRRLHQLHLLLLLLLLSLLLSLGPPPGGVADGGFALNSAARVLAQVTAYAMSQRGSGCLLLLLLLLWMAAVG